jgi:hypothetical protein
MTQVPESVKDFLRNLPDSWDDVKFIDGYPGKLYVVARKSGNTWYVAGINGENIEKNLSLDLSFIKTSKAQVITTRSLESAEPSFNNSSVNLSAGKLEVNLKGNDGFVAVIE